jgi:hypothetical protein
MAALKQSMESKGRAKVRMQCAGEWASLRRRNCQRREAHGHDQARAGRRIEAYPTPFRLCN